MPQLGNIKRDWELGHKKHNRKYMWAACADCGKERWVFLVNVPKRVPAHNYCYACGIKNGEQPKHYKGERNARWKGGKHKVGLGYYKIYTPDNPRADKGGYVYEHILVWEQVHNKPLPKGWVVHHLNGIKDDNRPRNLIALPKLSHYLVLAAKAKRIQELEALLNGQGHLL